MATFGFLEDLIPRFLLALEGSRDAKEYTEDEVEKWVGSLERSLSDPLGAYKERLTLPGRRSQVRTEKTHPGYRVRHDYWPYRR